MSQFLDNYKNKINFYYDVIKNTFISMQRYKAFNILTLNDINTCISNLEKISNLLKGLEVDDSDIIDTLQFVNNSISNCIKSYGTNNINDLMSICFNKSLLSKILLDKDLNQKYKLIENYCHPVNYKILNWNNKCKKNLDKQPLQKNKLIDDNMLIEKGENLDCFDLARTNNNFKIRINGLKFIIHNPEVKQTLVIFCIVDDIVPQFMNYDYINNKLRDLYSIEFDDNVYNKNTWERFVDSLSLKELLVYNIKELYDRYVGCINQINLLQQKTIYQIVQEFIGSELFNQRNMIIKLLLNENRQEFQYIAYLLYDLLTSDNNGNIDTVEQTTILDSLPWKFKQYFKDAMAKTINYTNDLCNFDNNKIPLEQQICLMKVSDYVKEKAMQKLKEVKSKSDDSGSKARQYLDGLLKIPFNIYVKEEILSIREKINNSFYKLTDIFTSLDNYKLDKEFIKLFELDNSVREKYFKETNQNSNTNVNQGYNFNTLEINNFNTLEINNFIKYIRDEFKFDKKILNYIIDDINRQKKNNLLKIINIINNKFIDEKINSKILIKQDISNLKSNVIDLIKSTWNDSNNIKELLNIIYSISNKNVNVIYNNINVNILDIHNKNSQIKEYIYNVNEILDNAVYGHKNAKKQIERIIGQWINGETTGYSFGFEGAPGIGKTSLAKKGISNCLKNCDGTSRPFAFIAIGGSSNASVLDGHNYTYVGSTWGKIVDILIEKKCMNPIIFIDELDKVSRTEHGKEIISILTHLIDSTQNNVFQDKYFSGIDIDLSKVLFIFSYNDAESIDRILLDRIHRVKFDNLTLKDKLIITKNYLLPEIYKNIGLQNIINISDDTINYLIANYTNECGVRKLKELLFEIIGDINLNILKNTSEYSFPLEITIENIENILREKPKVKKVMINNESKVGIINGLWANSLGNGGILHIEIAFFSTNTFSELKLTGMQGDVMKESMQVAKTLAWNLIDKDAQIKLREEFENTKKQGIHIHVPEGATPKDGPSAGTAITLAIYSTLTNKKIKNNIAITGEICLQGKITAIGGLDLKILGGINAGVDTFLFPKENEKEFEIFLEKYRDDDLLKGINFHKVENIDQAIALAIE